MSFLFGFYGRIAFVLIHVRLPITDCLFLIFIYTTKGIEYLYIRLDTRQHVKYTYRRPGQREKSSDDR